MTAVIRWTHLFALAALLVLGACGGGSSGDDTAGGGTGGSGSGDSQYAEGGMGGSGSGTSSGYGSIIVNETRHFPIDPHADIFVDGDRVPADSINDVDRGLPLGMTLEYVLAGDANATLTEGTAIRIHANHRAIGPVTRASTDTQPLRVLGQPVLITSETRLDGLSRSEVENLAEGDVVKVDGHVNAAGTIRATRLAQPAAVDQWQLMGRVGTVNTSSFTINGQTVEPGGINPDCVLSSGTRVLIRAGTDNATFGGDQTLDTVFEILCPAESLSLYEGLTSDSSFPAAAEGIVTQPPDLGGGKISLSLNGQEVVVDPDNLTEILFGTVDDLRLGARIEVSGTLNTATGVITAESVRFRDPLVEIVGPVEGGIADELLLTLGLEVRPTPEMTGNTGLFADPGSAGQVRILGFVGDDGTVYAQDIQDSTALQESLKGPVWNVDDTQNQVLIADAVFDTDSANSIEVVDLGGALICTVGDLLNLLCGGNDLSAEVDVGSTAHATSADWSGSELQNGDLDIFLPGS